MDIQSEKRAIINRFKRIDDASLIRAIRNLLDYALKQDLKDKDDNAIVGYNPNGTAITKAQLMSDIKKAELEMEQGEYVTIDELEKESKRW